MSTVAIPGTTTIVELDDDDIAQIVASLEGDITRPAERLTRKVTGADEYTGLADEYVRLTLRDRRLRDERSRIARRLAALDEVLAEEFAERGINAQTHNATGKTLRRDTKLWARYQKQDKQPTDAEKTRAAEALKAGGLDQYVYPTFNTNSVSAYFRERLKAWTTEQDERPEHDREPLTPDVIASWLPAEMRDVWTLDMTPTFVVR